MLYVLACDDDWWFFFRLLYSFFSKNHVLLHGAFCWVDTFFSRVYILTWSSYRIRRDRTIETVFFSTFKFLLTIFCKEAIGAECRADLEDPLACCMQGSGWLRPQQPKGELKWIKNQLSNLLQNKTQHTNLPHKNQILLPKAQPKKEHKQCWKKLPFPLEDGSFFLFL